MPHQWIQEYIGKYELSIWSGPYAKQTLYSDAEFLQTYFWLYTQGKKYLQIFSADENSLMGKLDIVVEGTQELIIEQNLKEAYQTVVQAGVTKTYWLQVHGPAGEGIHGLITDGKIKVQFVLIGSRGKCFLYLRSAVNSQRAYDENEIVTITFNLLQSQAEKNAVWTQQSYLDFERSMSFHYPQAWKVEDSGAILKLIPDRSFGDSLIFVYTLPANGHIQADNPSVISFFEGQIAEVNSSWDAPKRVGKAIPVQAFGKEGVLLKWDQKDPSSNLMKRVRLFLVIQSNCIVCLWAQGIAEESKKRDKALTLVFQTFKGPSPHPVKSQQNTQQFSPQKTQPTQTSYQTNPTNYRQQSCMYCSGSGLITCSSCNGMGYHTSSYTSVDWQGNPEYVTQNIPCGCSGGRSTCPTCGGSGMK